MELLVIIMMLSPGGLLGIPMSTPPLPPDPTVERAAPDTCLVHLETAGVATPDTAATNSVERMLAHEDVRTFLAEVVRELVSAAQQSMTLPPDVEDAALVLLRSTLDRPWTLSIERFTPPSAAAPPDIMATFLLRAGDREDKLRRAMTVLLGNGDASILGDDEPATRGRLHRQETPYGPLSWAFVDGSLLVTIGEKAIESFVERISDQGRSTPGWKADISRRLPVDRRATLLHVDFGAIVSMMAAVAPDERHARAVIAATGLGGLRSVDAVSGLDGQGFVADLRLGFEDAPAGIFAASQSGIGVKQLSRVPGDAVRVQSWTLDGASWLDTVLRIATATEPRAAAAMQQALEQFEGVAGFDLKTDLLAAIGPDWTLYDLPGTGALMPGTALVVGVRDHATFAAAHEKLLALLEQSRVERKPTVDRSAYRGHAIQTLSVAGSGMALPISPSWCLLEDRLVISLSPQFIKSLVDGEAATGLECLAEVQNDVGDQPADYVSVVDTRVAVRTLSSAYEFAAPMARQAAAQSGMMIHPPELPPAIAIDGFLAPAVTVMRHEADGIRLRGKTTLPLGPLVALGGGASSTASTSLLVGLLLPAVQSARDAANRAQTANNFKQIMLAMLNSESAAQRLPSQAICDDHGKPLLSWRVAILPYLGEEQLYRKFHLDEPWDSPHNRRLIGQMPNVYADPGADPAAIKAGLTTFQVFTGDKTTFVEPSTGPMLREISDGVSNTIALAEMLPDEAVPWTKPADHAFDADKPLDGVGNPRRAKGLFVVGFFDGTVLSIEPGIEAQIFTALVTPAGGEVISLP